MVINDVGVYFPESSTNVFHFHISQCFGPAQQNFSYYTDYEILLNSQHRKKVACFQIPYPYDTSIESEIDAVYDHVDQVIVLGSELHPRTVQFIKKFDRLKIAYFICGFLNFRLEQAQLYPFFDWFTTSVHFYKNVKPSVLYQLNHSTPKPYVFDALLGRKKIHRDQANRYIDQHIKDRGIVTYVDNHQIDFKNANDNNWLWELDGLSEHESVEWTVDRVRYYGHRMSLSQVIPISVYNQTAYSLVAETNFDNEFVFYTEKTVKPIVARRPFILLGNLFALEGLRKLGFKTFHGIINENYDTNDLTQARHEMALDQLRWLCEQDQTSILSRCQSIVDHNYDVMMGTDWYNLFRVPFSRLIS